MGFAAIWKEYSFTRPNLGFHTQKYNRENLNEASGDLMANHDKRRAKSWDLSA